LLWQQESHLASENAAPQIQYVKRKHQANYEVTQETKAGLTESITSLRWPNSAGNIRYMKDIRQRNLFLEHHDEELKGKVQVVSRVKAVPEREEEQRYAL